jgi:hypothetical protein
VDYDGELPRGGRAAEVRAMLAPFAASDDVELVCELASRELPEGQALHGDAHLFEAWFETSVKPAFSEGAPMPSITFDELKEVVKA